MFYTGIGSRATPDEVLAKMTQIAQAFARKGWVLRSGGAKGADSAFEAGAGERKEIFLPWPGFNGRQSSFSRPSAAALEMAAQLHPAWERCSQGARKLHARNTHQILGYDLKSPTSLVVCWTEGGGLKGGTAQAIRLATLYSIPVFNLGAVNGLSSLQAWWRRNVA